MRVIELTRGGFTIVDNRDYDWLNQWKWQYTKSVNGNCYVTGHKGQMARLIMGLTTEDTGKVVKHLNGDTLDNRREYLEIGKRNCMLPVIRNTNRIAYDRDENSWGIRLKNEFIGWHPTKEAAFKALEAHLNG